VEFLLSCDSGCTVHFEPESTEHRLEKGQSFRVELSGEPEYVEIAHGPAFLSLWTQGCEIRAWNDAGDELAL
jgi:hypothetical protein